MFALTKMISPLINRVINDALAVTVDLHETKREHYETFLEGIQLFSVCGTSPMEQTSSISSRSLSVGHLRVLSSIAWL